MKKGYLYIGLVLLLASCSSSFLDKSPESQLSAGTFYQTENDFTQAMNAVYAGLRGVTGQENLIMGEQRSDNVHYIPNLSDRGYRFVEDVSNFQDDPTNEFQGNYYNNSYRAIAKTNAILDRITQVELDPEFTNKIIGQSKFMRAYLYFGLVQYFGSVPLVVNEVTTSSESFVSRSSIDAIYTQIIDDLQDADNLLTTATFPQDGHVSKGSVEMLLARVLMTQPTRDYATAESLLKNIMSMGYALNPSYSEAFDPNNKNSSESIFEVNYLSSSTGLGSAYIYWMMPITDNTTIVTGFNTSNASNGAWCIPTQEMIDSYEPGDTRLEASISVAIGTLDPGSNKMKIDEVVSIADANSIPITPSTYHLYFSTKYRHGHEIQWSTNDSWPIFRYSDALLSYAECCVENGHPADGIEAVNQVRSRAGLTSVSSIDADIVANERRHEFAFEAKRWLDLVRTGTAISTMNSFGNYIKGIDPLISSSAYNVDEHRLIYPIPYRETSIGKLTQNPGY